MGPQPKNTWISFRDGNKKNCKQSNLYYQTPTQIYEHQQKLHPNRNNGAAYKLKPEQVKQIRRDYAKGGLSYHKLAEIYGVSFQTIWKIVKLRIWKNI